MNRPTLIPGIPRVWRNRHELQLGSDPACAVVLRLPDPRAARVLDLLDGSRPERVVMLEAVQEGVPPDDARAVLDALDAAGLTVPAAALLPPTRSAGRLTGEAAVLALRGSTSRTPASRLRRRQAARVVISGRGRLGAPIAVALAEAGVGHIHPDLPGRVQRSELAGGPLRASDLGKPRGAAVIEALRRSVEGIETQAVRGQPATLVVQLDPDRPVTLVSAAHASRRQPHLAVTIRDGAAVIGPLVPATGGPCLGCLDLHRRDRDSAWPGLPPHTAPEPCTVATLLAATALAVEEVLTFIDDGDPMTAGASIELTTASRQRRRTWPQHPECDCARLRRRAKGLRTFPSESGQAG
ncbi:ThiF family adenylyltransferase [Actinoplanes bogorensis]|uniref:ThiF family adenylyltransferase n=1 Tax=Paractinoplanes bogorensis TaxID=1610840 RepID=A0ABS5Z5A8_9ACTN|nr:ThiF family adenylyltransferase [Actinoplanes bogorensis]MBU2670882.1 ThiF family adenylyltransferase [Actinoplanes bogorensis]